MTFHDGRNDAAPNNPFDQAPQNAPAVQPLPAYPTPVNQPYGAMPHPHQPGQYIFRAPKSKVIAIVLAFFLGFLGVHNYYLGYNKIGLFQLALYVVSIFTVWFIIGGVGLLALGIWLIVDMIQIGVGSGRYSTDVHGVPLS